MDAKVLYIAGNEGSGKSPVCRMVDNFLENKGFEEKGKNTLNGDDYVIYRTIPLARINKNTGGEVHDWYHKAVDKLVKHVLESNPFNL